MHWWCRVVASPRNNKRVQTVWCSSRWACPMKSRPWLRVCGGWPRPPCTCHEAWGWYCSLPLEVQRVINRPVVTSSCPEGHAKRPVVTSICPKGHAIRMWTRLLGLGCLKPLPYRVSCAFCTSPVEQTMELGILRIPAGKKMVGKLGSLRSLAHLIQRRARCWLLCITMDCAHCNMLFWAVAPRAVGRLHQLPSPRSLNGIAKCRTHPCPSRSRNVARARRPFTATGACQCAVRT